MTMLSRRALLGSSAAAGLALGARATGTGGALAPPTARPKNLITVLAKGGWDVTFCLDPKLGVDTIEGPEVDLTGHPDDEEAIEQYGEIAIAANHLKRPAVSAFFQRWAPYAHVVNGIWMGSIAHDPCRFRILTGTTFSSHPDVATIAGATLGAELPLGAIDLSGWSMPGSLAAASGSIGYQSQLRALIDPSTLFHAPVGAAPYPQFQIDPADASAAAAHKRARAEAFAAARGAEPRALARIDDLAVSWDRADRLRAQSALVAGRLPFGEQPDLALQTELAVDLLEAGMCRAVTLESRSDWDTHDLNVLQHGFYDALFMQLYSLADALDARGMLDDTLVAVVSEMTRTPMRNGSGKDHWPHTSALVFGGGVRGAGRSGGTDDLLESLPIDLATGAVATSGGSLLRYDSFAAGILRQLDVDPEPWLPGVPVFAGLGASS